jgi:hypothetical protein
VAYVKATNGQVDQYPYTVGQLRRDNPNTSFPKSIPESTLNEWGVYTVQETSEPTYNKATQYTSETNPVFSDGVWKVTWQVNTRSIDEQAAYDQVTAIANRKRRDDKLMETDWHALSDVTMSAEMTTYRQALRDITTHANWPHLNDDDWPTKP